MLKIILQQVEGSTIAMSNKVNRVNVFNILDKLKIELLALITALLLVNSSVSDVTVISASISNTRYVKNMKYSLNNWSCNWVVATYLKNGVYTGYIKNKIPDGKGTFSVNSKDYGITIKWSYSGSWKNGRPNGYGVMNLSYGLKYSGQWKNGQPDGKCEIVPAVDGTLRIVGTYKIDKFIGNATYYFMNGDKFIGCFDTNLCLLQGDGTFIYKDGRKVIGTWKNGKYISNTKYNVYKGKWICSQFCNTSDGVMKKGGMIIYIQDVTGDCVEGNIMSISAPPANRIAATDFSGTVLNDKLAFLFKDDGWYDNGKFSITFKKDKLILKIDTTISKENLSGWNLGNGMFEFVREKK